MIREMAISPARYAPHVSAPIVYYTLAAILGAGWFLVLLVPPWTRAWLTGESRMAGWSFAEMVLTSVIVAGVFRRAIRTSHTWRSHLVRALTIPYAGCLIYLTVWNAGVWARTLFLGGLANLHDSLAVYAWGTGYALIACFVVVPYGLVCQVVLKEFLDRTDAER
jgi:hypothetical protein